MLRGKLTLSKGFDFCGEAWRGPGLAQAWGVKLVAGHDGNAFQDHAGREGDRAHWQRRATGLKAGDPIKVVLTLETAPQTKPPQGEALRAF